MSDDVQAMLAGFMGGGSTAAPATFYEYETGLTVPAAQPTTTGTTTDQYIAALGKLAGGVSKAGQAIGAGRAATAEGRIANRIASMEAQREKMRGRRLASTARAITGAQGTTMEGSPLLAELSILQAAEQDANTEIFKGNINEYNARVKAKNAYFQAPGDLLSALLEAQQELKTPPVPGRPGKSLLTGR